MKTHSIEEIISAHPFFQGLRPAYLKLVTGCARNVHFDEGAYIEREGDPANRFYLLRHGRVALQMSSAGKPAIIFDTLGAGEVLGVSWLVPPYRFAFDARALESTSAIALDAVCLRGKCEDNHDLGYDLMKRFVPVLVSRMMSARLQALDIYKPEA